MPLLGDVEQCITHSFYDTLRFKNGHEFFGSHPLFTDPSKGIRETNIVRAGQLERKHSFLLRRIWMEIEQASKLTLTQLVQDCRFEFRLSGTTYLQGPVTLLALEHTLSRIISILKKRNIRSKSLQLAICSLQFGQLIQPILIHSSETFVLEVRRSNPLTLDHDFTARFFLDGELYRPVDL